MLWPRFLEQKLALVAAYGMNRIQKWFSKLYTNYSRDVQATGRGAHTLAGISAYCVGNLRIPHNPMPWEQKEGTGVVYASNLATPLEIEVEASNGASDYGYNRTFIVI